MIEKRIFPHRKTTVHCLQCTERYKAKNSYTYLLDVQPGLYTVLASTTGPDTTRFVKHGNRILRQQQTSGQWHHLLNDGLGSVRSVLDANHLPLETVHYTPYGAGSPTESLHGFTGEPTDANGLVHLRARYYDPALGVFQSLDQIEFTHRYGYASNNPTNLVDPSGLEPRHPGDPCPHGFVAASTYGTETMCSQVRDLGTGELVPQGSPVRDPITLQQAIDSYEGFASEGSLFSELANIITVPIRTVTEGIPELLGVDDSVQVAAAPAIGLAGTSPFPQDDWAVIAGICVVGLGVAGYNYGEDVIGGLDVEVPSIDIPSITLPNISDIVTDVAAFFSSGSTTNGNTQRRTCSRATELRLNDRMHKICGGSSKCTGEHSCAELMTRLTARVNCMNSRWLVVDRCFGGILDNTHLNALIEQANGLNKCMDAIRRNCTRTSRP